MSGRERKRNVMFAALMTELVTLLRWCFKDRDPEEREEMVAEGVAQSFRLFDSAHRRGNSNVSAKSLAWYTTRAVRSGRTFVWRSNDDVRPVAHLEDGNLDELLAADTKGWGPPDQVAFRIDFFEEFLGRCTSEETEAVTLLAMGHSRSRAASLVGVSPAWMTKHMAKLQQDWDEFSSAEPR